MIKVENLVKRYGANYALNDVSFEIGEGEVVGLLGPNGAGKSTTMNILTGFLAATSGTATIGGVDIREDPIAAKRMIGYLPEQPPLYPDMTVEEYLNFVYELKGCTLERGPHLAEIMSVVKLTDVRGRLIRNLSKGYKQRVGIAQALIGDPKVVIFDEPTVGLDPKQILEVRNLIRALSKNHTVILSTHILAEVQSVCQRVLIINRGRLIADKHTDELARSLEDSVIYRAKIAGPEREVTNALRAMHGMKSVTATAEKEADATVYLLEGARGFDIRKPLFRLLAGANYPLLELAPTGTDLESIFIRLVERSDAADAPSVRK
ncbi:MAG: ABC transporter ATP-binding protein [Clostridia bacterium]|nr:ABC transporter ATP-binding protein [Clostridia bacterium]